MSESRHNSSPYGVGIDMMKIKITMDKSKVKIITDAQLKAAAQTAEQMLHEIVTAAVIPFDTGNLQNVASYVDTKALKTGIVHIAHEAPYAQRLYYNPQYNFGKTFNVNAKGLWWDEWLQGNKIKRPQILYQEFFRKLTSGVVK